MVRRKGIADLTYVDIWKVRSRLMRGAQGKL